MRWRDRLFVRLFGASALIAVVAVGAATFATVGSTTVAVREAQQQSLGDDARVYDALIGYAATHRTWAAARPLVRRLARPDTTVTVTDVAGRPLVTSAATATRQPPGRARATLDPLDVDTALLPPTSPARTPQRAVRRAVTPQNPVACADTSTSCRRFVVTGAAPVDPRAAGPDGADGKRTSAAVIAATDRCLTRAGLGHVVTLLTADSVLVRYPGDHAGVARCLDESRRDVLRPYVTPPALLFVGGGASSADVFWNLSRHNQIEIGLLAIAVLLVTLLLCAVLAARIVGPLRRMAATARLAGEGDLSARVAHRRHDEIGEVARAFNTMAERREQLELSRRRLVSDVSHELRTPLSNVRAWLEGAQDGLVDNDARLVTSLLEETLQLQALVEDLHELSGLSDGGAGELRVHPQHVELGPFLAQLANSFRVSCDAAQVTLQVLVEPGASVPADPVRLRQAVGNLVANALRHTPAGGTVVVRARPGRVVVADTGEGIPAQDLEHVFERFRRVDASRSRATGGSGLGLAIVAQIMLAHGGQATIDSAVGAGTTVTLSFAADPSPSGGGALVSRPAAGR